MSPRERSRRRANTTTETEPLVAEVCLYGTRETGFAYLASAPGLSAPIAARGGWNADETRPSGAFLSLTEIVEQAKADLRALGLREGRIIVFFPGGQQCARTPIDEFEAVADMRREPAPVVVVTREMIADAGRRLSASRLGASAAPLATTPGRATLWTSTGKPVPELPGSFAALEKAASDAVHAYGALSEEAQRATHAAQAALRAHVEGYARDFTADEHRDAARLVEEDKRARWAQIDRFQRYALNGVVMLHERAADALDHAAERARRLG